MKQILLLILAITLSSCGGTNAQTMKKLTPAEHRVIVEKGTEAPFTGKYFGHFEDGTYHCKQCGAPLYKSNDKFDSSCGWPSFDDQIEGAVKRVPDADGRRTEIVCAKCGGHLGHVFEGEQLTDKNTRHCVNSLSLDFQRSNSVDQIPVAQTAIFAGGCFWGVEHLMQKQTGVINVLSGYIGGTVENPTYEQICTGKTGHAEAVQVLYDPSKVTYEQLAKLFFEIHDPTQTDGQGPDLGNQYRSEIFYNSPEQQTIASDLISRLRSNGYRVVTRLTPAGVFYPAEKYHQDYYIGKGTEPYCHAYTKRF